MIGFSQITRKGFLGRPASSNHFRELTIVHARAAGITVSGGLAGEIAAIGVIAAVAGAWAEVQASLSKLSKPAITGED